MVVSKFYICDTSTGILVVAFYVLDASTGVSVPMCYSLDSSIGVMITNFYTFEEFTILHPPVKDSVSTFHTLYPLTCFPVLNSFIFDVSTRGLF